ncbi:hypothetical protein LSCM1_00012 [Leishmania martiniquensis]|uniref:Uncharacterized protein n=1 Tax=Leishmania martiniquensis TaxID=1580590 RepID=A0A836GRW9_9TRYP|nr:hypothetical protein LSCM1_00012 [Leishmania martiniquensis]
MSLSQLTRPSDGALRTALQAMLAKLQPPPLVPHPPASKMAWRTRRIVEELKALSCVEALESYETELRELVDTQETRCRTKLVNRAYREECALREEEQLRKAEAAGRCHLVAAFYSSVQGPFEVIHLRLLEELARRSLRYDERAAWRALRWLAYCSRLGLRGAEGRAALEVLEECSRDELKSRRLIELGDQLQRAMLLQRCAAAHSQYVGHSKSVVRARRQVELQEEKDRDALERLYSLQVVQLLLTAKADFAAALQRDVVLLSESSRVRRQQVQVADCDRCMLACLGQEQRLRLMVEEEEHALRRTVMQGFLLGWRSVYKQITKDADVTRVFAKIELLVRRDLMDQQRLEFRSLALASQTQASVLKRHQIERRVLCQRYIDGARVISGEENREVNELFGAHHVWRREQAALHRATVVSMEEVASRRAIRGAEAQARLALRLQYLLETLELRLSEGRRCVVEEEERCLDALRQHYVFVFYVQRAQRLIGDERVRRMLIERDEAAAAVDFYLPLRQVLVHSFVSDACRPLSRVEDEFRARVATEEARERFALLRQNVLLSEAADRARLFDLDRRFRCRIIAARVSAEEEDERGRLCISVMAEMFLVMRCILESWERERRGTFRKCEALVRESLLLTTAPPARRSLCRSADVMDIWGEMEADWGDATSDADGWSAELPLYSQPSLMCASTLCCEDMLVEAYLERDLLHFMEQREWLHLLHQEARPDKGADSSDARPPCWRLHSLSMQLVPQQRAAYINVWHSNHSFDVCFPLIQRPDEAIVGECTISFYEPDARMMATLMERDAGTGMVFFLVLDEEEMVLASATIVAETVSACSAHLCIPFDNSRGFIRLV